MTVVIGFDTATRETVVAAVRDAEILTESAAGPPGADARPAHATQLMPQLESAAAAAGGWQSVERLAVGIGPGSFTGLRIGVASARALAQALELPLAGVGTLEALARGIRERDGAGRPALAVIDAGRGEVFAALFDRQGGTVWEPMVASPAELAARLAQLGDPVLAAGSGAVRFRRELQEGGAEIPGQADSAHRVAARHLCALGAAAPETAQHDVAPVYLRPPDAERWRERDSRDNR